jgi:protein O-GlcNAc transferase
MNVTESLDLVLEHMQSGKIRQAEHVCKKILKKQPDNADALHFLGVIYFESGNYDLARDTIKKAIQIDPDFADAYNNLGNIYYQTKQIDEAITYYRKALDLNPDLARTYYNLGIALQEKKQFDEAIHCYQRALKLSMSSFGLYNNLGLALHEKGQLDEAIDCYQSAINIDPHYAEAYYNLGNAMKDTEQPEQALIAYEKAIQLNPIYADAYNNLGIIFKIKGQFDEAATHYQKALQLDPALPSAHLNLGAVFQEKGQFDEAITHYQKALQLDPTLPSAYLHLGAVFQEKGQFDEAIVNYQKALHLNPNLANACNNLGATFKDIGQINEAEIWLRRAIQIEPDNSSYYSNLLLIMNYNESHDTKSVFIEHLNFSKKYEAKYLSSLLPHTNKREPSRKLKIGYVSPDFRKHPVAYFIEAALLIHSRENFTVFCYSNSLIEDEVTRRIKEHADQWRNIIGMSDNDVSELIRKDEIDILVDLAGHTAHNRILVFARKPAPVQVSWIGYPPTTGLSAIDYKIADNYTDPPGETEQFYTENLIRLPKCFFCYLPMNDAPDIGTLPVIINGYITFGSLNNFAKVTPCMYTLWSNILMAVPESRLIMKWKSFSDRTAIQYAENMFKERGINEERIILQSWERAPEHLRAYNSVDVGLDTFPFNGLTTTCEALWMGVPVISLTGTAYASRSGASVLSNVGLAEFIAQTSEEYIHTAVNLAEDIQKLKYLREYLRDMMMQSPLCDAKRFTKDLEVCYRTMWETWCRSR